MTLSPAEHAVLYHVRDTVVQPRDVLATWVAENPLDERPLSVEDCRHAIDALLRRELLIELTEADIEQDLARWDAEPFPVSQGVDRNRVPGQIDLTEEGFRLFEGIEPQRSTHHVGFNDEAPDVIRVFGETEESCVRAMNKIVAFIDQPPWYWARTSVQIAPMRPLGPWWYSRFVRVPMGFEIVVRRAPS